MALSLLRGLLARRQASIAEGTHLPDLRLRVEQVRTGAYRLNRYRRACRFKNRDYLPATFPQVLAMPMHTALLAHPEFPLQLLGLIHLRNLIVQHRPISPDEVLTVEVHNTPHRDVEAGQEFDLCTDVYVDGELVWEGVSTILARTRRAGSRNSRRPAEEENEPAGEVRESWQVRSYYGRRYARISHDFNPIHLAAITSRWFGFKRPIVHGMWSLARCVAALDAREPIRRARIEARFLLPIFMPGWTTFVMGREGAEQRFRLLDARGRRPHVHGSLTPLDS